MPLKFLQLPVSVRRGEQPGNAWLSLFRESALKRKEGPLWVDPDLGAGGTGRGKSGSTTYLAGDLGRTPPLPRHRPFPA